MAYELIAYEGEEFTIEWFFDEKGRSQALDYFNDSSKEQKRRIFHLFRVMATMGKIHDLTKFRHEGDGIYAFKPQPDRYLCFFYKDQKIVVTNAFEKRIDKLPVIEKEKALQAQKSYVKRTKEGMYYEKEKE